MTIAEIARSVGGTLVQAPNAEDTVRELAYDSRRIQQRDDTLFYQRSPG